MVERGSGTVINITSGAGYADPPAAAGQGGWGLGYGASKGAMHRIAGILALETEGLGVRAYNVQPGFIATERIDAGHGWIRLRRVDRSSARVVGRVCVWLLESPDAAHYNGQNIEAQELCSELNLLPGWSLTPAG